MEAEEREREVSAIRRIMRARAWVYRREMAQLRRDLRRLRREAAAEQAQEAAEEAAAEQESDAGAA